MIIDNANKAVHESSFEMYKSILCDITSVNIYVLRGSLKTLIAPPIHVVN